ncbi:hypothetical protein [Bacillus pinisoli]|uniref:hypothetical protein n=1 Tax=Bacillus pinisoli TaxID=2901866 RepID=UPI001FF57FAF|nr:hypothetical protein [Bacillus pinisoli]
MIEKRLDRMEEMLTQLIQVVGTMNSSQHRMENRMDTMETKLHSMETRLEAMEAKNEERHQDILYQLSQLKIDQDIIWDKLSKEEREIQKLKKRLEN